MNGLDSLPVYTGPTLTKGKPKTKSKVEKKERKSKKQPRIFAITYGNFVVVLE